MCVGPRWPSCLPYMSMTHGTMPTAALLHPEPCILDPKSHAEKQAQQTGCRLTRQHLQDVGAAAQLSAAHSGPSPASATAQPTEHGRCLGAHQHRFCPIPHRRFTAWQLSKPPVRRVQGAAAARSSARGDGQSELAYVEDHGLGQVLLATPDDPADARVDQPIPVRAAQAAQDQGQAPLTYLNAKD